MGAYKRELGGDAQTFKARKGDVVFEADWDFGHCHLLRCGARTSIFAGFLIRGCLKVGGTGVRSWGMGVEVESEAAVTVLNGDHEKPRLCGSEGERG